MNERLIKKWILNIWNFTVSDFVKTEIVDWIPSFLPWQRSQPTAMKFWKLSPLQYQPPSPPPTPWYTPIDPVFKLINMGVAQGIIVSEVLHKIKNTRRHLNDHNELIIFLSDEIWARKGGGGVVVYQYTRKKCAKIPKNTQNSSKYTQNYIQVYFIPEIQRKWYTEYPYLSCNMPYTRFKKPLYTVYPKTLADPDKLKAFFNFEQNVLFWN